MSVIDRAALEGSPLADLHTIASELSIDGYRRLRKADLIERIIERQGGAEASAGEESEEDTGTAERADATDEGAEETGGSAGRRRRGRRGGRGRARGDSSVDAGEPANVEVESSGGVEAADELADTAEEAGAAPAETEATSESEDASVEGVVELLANGSGFVRVSPPDPSDDDVYISAAQVKRCELVNGDRVAGPKRSPRRSERFASLIRVDTINGRPAAEQADGVRYDELPAGFATDRFRLGSEDPTLKAIEFLTPFGRGSRVTIVGGPRAGKSRALRYIGEALAADEEIQLFVALAGVRPEEISEWPGDGRLAPAAALSFAASPDALAHVVELVVDQARRLAARGADAVVLIDTLDGLHPHAARKAMAAARNILDGGSLTVIATAGEPLGGETTLIALDAALAGAGRYPAVDLVASGTTRAELLVGEPGAQAIAQTRAEALDGA